MPSKPPVYKQASKKIKSKRRARVYDKQFWRGPNGIRQAKLKANPLCEDCERRGLVVAAVHVDHVDGNAENMKRSNLQSLCAPCHSRKTVTYDGGFGNAKRRVVG